MTSGNNLHAIIPAGGAGTRLWPLSRAYRPKFLLDLTGSGASLLQATWHRLDPVASSITVVAGRQHSEAVAAQLPKLHSDRLLVEPAPRDSMAAIGLATALIWRREPQAVIGSFAADHVINGQAAFEAAARSAVAVAEAGYVCTIGVVPDHPSTAYGYVATGNRLSNGALEVSGFVEKPDTPTARSYLEAGRHRWNAGMFIARADVLLGHLREQLPRLHEGLLAIADAWDTPQRRDTLVDVWPTLTRISIDHAIAEPVAASGGMACIPATFAWDDLGDFAALSRQLPDREPQVLGDSTQVAAVEATGLVVTASERTVTLFGVHDLVVVDTPDALLVTTRANAQRVAEARSAWQGVRDDLL